MFILCSNVFKGVTIVRHWLRFRFRSNNLPLVFHYKLNDAVNVQDYTIFAAIMYEETLVIDQVCLESVVMREVFRKYFERYFLQYFSK